jgi:hypothetical protein
VLKQVCGVHLANLLRAKHLDDFIQNMKQKRLKGISYIQALRRFEEIRPRQADHNLYRGRPEGSASQKLKLMGEHGMVQL